MPSIALRSVELARTLANLKSAAQACCRR